MTRPQQLPGTPLVKLEARILMSCTFLLRGRHPAQQTALSSLLPLHMAPMTNCV